MHSRIYNIKKLTNEKVMMTIYEIILKEWNIKYNLALEWNHLYNQINTLSISDHNKWDQILSEDK